MDLTTVVAAIAVIVTVITLLLILIQAARILWRIIPTWLMLALGSILAIGIIILVTT